MSQIKRKPLQAKHLQSNPSLPNTNRPLKGEELAQYIEANKEEFKDKGDELCVGAGYGKYLKDGTPKCDFKPFVKELGKAMNLED